MQRIQKRLIPRFVAFGKHEMPPGDVGIECRAGPRIVVEYSRIGRPDGQRKPRFARFQFSGRVFALPASLRIAQLPFDGHAEPLQVIFHQIIVRAGFHQRHSGILADRARNHQKRNIQTGFLEHRKSFVSVEPGHPEIRNDGVPRGPGKRVAHLAGVLRTLRFDRETGGIQLPHNQRRIAFRILNL